MNKNDKLLQEAKDKYTGTDGGTRLVADTLEKLYGNASYALDSNREIIADAITIAYAAGSLDTFEELNRRVYVFDNDR